MEGPRPDLTRLQISNKGVDQRAVSLGYAVVFGLLFAAVCALGAWCVVSGGGERSAPAVVAVATPAAAPIVAVAERLSATGYVVAQRRAAVSSKATGRLKELYVKEGSVVQQDQVIGVLENDDLAAAVREQGASLEAAEARLQYAEAELKVAQLQQTRVRLLSPENAVSQSARDEAEARQQKAVADLALSRAQIGMIKAQLEKAKVDLDYTYIRAPFEGTVLTKNADIGEIVTSFGSATNARAAVVTIADMKSLQVEADVSEANITRVTLNQPCMITLDAFPGKRYEGVVDSIVPTVDRAKATVLVKIRFVEKDADVLPEMSAKVDFALQSERVAEAPQRK